MAEPSKTPRKRAAKATKVPAPARTSTRGRARTAAAPAEVVEEQAVTRALPRPAADRPAARAAAAMRGEATAEAAPAVVIDAADDEWTEDSAEQQAARDEAAAAEQAANTTVETIFKGRKMMVRTPSQEQLIIYRRLSKEFQDLTAEGATDSMTLDEALRQMDRAVRLVQSVLDSPRDREWIEDQLLEGNLTLEECTGLLRDGMKSLNAKHIAQTEAAAAANGNRATRRRAGSRARLADA